jgi:hypothetical protein
LNLIYLILIIIVLICLQGRKNNLNWLFFQIAERHSQMQRYIFPEISQKTFERNRIENIVLLNQFFYSYVVLFGCCNRDVPFVERANEGYPFVICYGYMINI